MNTTTVRRCELIIPDDAFDEDDGHVRHLAGQFENMTVDQLPAELWVTVDHEDDGEPIHAAWCLALRDGHAFWVHLCDGSELARVTLDGDRVVSVTGWTGERESTVTVN
jgi:hypothetical protein